MTEGAHDLTELTRAAQRIRAAADLAACDDPADRVCCWTTQTIAGQEAVIATRIDAEGHESGETVAVPLAGGVAGHIGLWGPNAARTVAGWLESVAELHEPKPAGQAAGGCVCALSSCQWCNDEDRPCADVRHALALAREILGTKHTEVLAAATEHDALAANRALVE